MAEQPPSRVYTLLEAAEWLRLDKEVLRRACKEGRLPAAKIGREWRIDGRVLDDLLLKGLDISGDDENDDDEKGAKNP